MTPSAPEFRLNLPLARRLDGNLFRLLTAAGGPSGDGILLEDGTSFVKLENDTDYALKE